MSVRQMGGLRCRVIPERSAQPALAVVLCHGYGAPGDDLVPLVREMRQLQPTLEEVRFYFPEGPLSPPGMEWMGGKAWWHIDMMALQSALMQGDIGSLRNQVPDGLSSARRKLRALVDGVLGETALGFSRLVLGGFSQGAMLATDLTLRLEEPPAALAILSGTLIAESQWRSLAPQRAGLFVFQSHGIYDPLLPFAAAQWLYDVLNEAGLRVDFAPFEDQHTIPHKTLYRFARILSELIPDDEEELDPWA